jgi:membrane protein DedA with SNARE-associated domain
VTHLLLHWGYLALAIATLVAAMGIPTGSELVIAFAGALASGKLVGSHDHLALVGVIGISTLGEVIGSLFGYSIGRIGGRPLLERIGKFVLITNQDLDRAEELFDRHGEPVAFFGRLVPIVRSFVGLGAGICEMAVARFVACTAAASAIWCSAFAFVGYEVGGRWSKDLHDVSIVTDVIAVLVAAGIVAFIAKRWRDIRASEEGLAAVRAEIARRGTFVAKTEEAAGADCRAGVVIIGPESLSEPK